MTTRNLRAPLVVALILSTLSSACESDRPTHDPTLASKQSAIRPTDGDGWYGNGYADDEVDVFDSPGGHFRVWFTRTGDHAVPEAEETTPPIVALVGDVADAVWAKYVDDLGFREPLHDDVYHDRPDYGGDGRVDIYLENLLDADGYIVVEACQQPPLHGCAGYFVIDDRFSPWRYASDEEAVRVLASHELFHLVQNAYSSNQKSFFTEGTAVWIEEVFWPEQDDYESFVAPFLEEPERPLDDQRPGDFSDIRPYGAALFFTFLSERYGDDIVRRCWEETVSPEGEERRSLEAIDLAIADYGSSLAEAFAEFGLWNALTGSRANTAFGYDDAGRYPAVPVETLADTIPPFRLEGSLPKLAAAYHLISLENVAPGSALRLRVQEGERLLHVQLLLERDGAWLPEPLEQDTEGYDFFIQNDAAQAIVVVTDARMRSNATSPYDIRIERASLPVDPDPEPDVISDTDAGAQEPDAQTSETGTDASTADASTADISTATGPDGAGSDVNANPTADEDAAVPSSAGDGCSSGPRSTGSTRPSFAALLLLLLAFTLRRLRRRPVA